MESIAFSGNTPTQRYGCSGHSFELHSLTSFAWFPMQSRHFFLIAIRRSLGFGRTFFLTAFSPFNPLPSALFPLALSRYPHSDLFSIPPSRKAAWAYPAAGSARYAGNRGTGSHTRFPADDTIRTLLPDRRTAFSLRTFHPRWGSDCSS